MKYLFILLAFAAGALAERKPGVAGCFNVHSMVRADAEHYWATWTNACPYTIDAVYVMVDFLDESRRPLGNGVWSLYFVGPGAGRTVRFSMPGEVPDFHSVRLLKVTADSEEALHPSPPRAFRRDRPTGDPGPDLNPPTIQAKVEAKPEEAPAWSTGDPRLSVSPFRISANTEPVQSKTIVYIGDPGPSIARH